eukprot:TRINITY_DN756_c0_g1_i1.p1 TRINITY_DN756_c0_g1~~TRINITY_DN756_c0_g1_i1.p1  ORF type:complete len:113 (-),score=21.34 TRINITY_DN756_c0_g1_i1:300-638(-)
MVYISNDGSVAESQSMWRLSIIPELFWNVLNQLTLFVTTMFSGNGDQKHKNRAGMAYKGKGFNTYGGGNNGGYPKGGGGGGGTSYFKGSGGGGGKRTMGTMRGLAAACPPSG